MESSEMRAMLKMCFILISYMNGCAWYCQMYMVSEEATHSCSQVETAAGTQLILKRLHTYPSFCCSAGAQAGVMEVSQSVTEVVQPSV